MNNQNRFYTVATIGNDSFHENISQILPSNSKQIKYGGFVNNDISEMKKSLSENPFYVIFTETRILEEYFQRLNPIQCKIRINSAKFGKNTQRGKEMMGSFLESLPSQSLQSGSSLDISSNGGKKSLNRLSLAQRLGFN